MIFIFICNNALLKARFWKPWMWHHAVFRQTLLFDALIKYLLYSVTMNATMRTLKVWIPNTVNIHHSGSGLIDEVCLDRRAHLKMPSPPMEAQQLLVLACNEVDGRILQQSREDKEKAHCHPNVNGFHIRDLQRDENQQDWQRATTLSHRLAESSLTESLA